MNLPGFGWFRPRRRLLIVCRANVCRSPMAEGMLRSMLKTRGAGAASLRVESAGTRVATVGRRPDRRAVKILAGRGLNIARHRARPVPVSRWQRYERILAVDEPTMRDLARILPPECHSRVRRLMDFAPPDCPGELPDPYYGNEAGFREVLRLLDQVLPAVLRDWESGRGPDSRSP